jgi:hypothetical protein
MYELMMRVRGHITTTELAHQSPEHFGEHNAQDEILGSGRLPEEGDQRQDRRMQKLSMTAEGRQLLSTVEEFHDAAVNRLFSEFSEKELDITLDLLLRARKYLEYMLGQEAAAPIRIELDQNRS